MKIRTLLILLLIAAVAHASPRRRAITPPMGTKASTLRIQTSFSGSAGFEGTFIEINGKRAGVTGADGALQTIVAPGVQNVRAFIPGMAEGMGSVSVAAGAATTIQIAMADAEAVEPASLVIDQARDAILPFDFQNFSAHFQRPDGTRALIRSIESVELSSAFSPQLGLPPVNVRESFASQPDGTIAVSPSMLATFRDALAELPEGPVVLTVTAADAEGLIFSSEAGFSIGQYRVGITLLPPPSNPSLPLANRTVALAVLNTPIDLRLQTDARGHFEALLPAGTAAINLEIVAGGRFYYARTSMTINADVDATVKVLGVTDLAQGFSQPNVNALLATASTSKPARRRTLPPRRRTHANDQESCDVNPTADGENDRITRVSRITVAQGTPSIALHYVVASDEYPYYVLSQSVYDDVWELGLFGPDGRDLFSITRQVNSQLYEEPAWQSDGTTGSIDRRIDVSSFTKNGPAELILFAAATNVGDDLLATSVCASVDLTSRLAIVSVEPEPAAASATTTATEIVNVSSANTVFSIPNAGSANTYAANFAVHVTPDASAVNRVRVEAFTSGGEMLGSGPLLDIAGSSIQRIDSATLRVPVTMTAANPSTINTVPPPTTRIYYRFTVSSATESATRETPNWKALWRWPGDRLGIKRFSPTTAAGRDKGGDDWCSRGAYEWIESNADFLRATSVNDISGEHGRDIGHTEHRMGTDIDVFYFTVFSMQSGTANYEQLRTRVLAAIDGNATAKADVTTFFTTARSRINELRNMSDVRKLFFGIGTAVPRAGLPSLPTGWMESLLRSGKVVDGGKELLNIGSEWSDYPGFSRVTVGFDSIHNNHLHIGLDESRIDPPDR